MDSPSILIIEDDHGLAESLSWYFNKEGFETHVAHSGIEGLQQAQTTIPDVVLLDIILPGMNGLDVCRELRAGERTREIPIILVSAKADESDQVVGYSFGADGYVTKPFSHKVLLAKVQSLLRRTERISVGVTECSGVKVDRVRHRVSFKNTPLDLTPTEFRLLELLVRKPDFAFRRHQLLDAGSDEGSTARERTIDAYIKAIRQKLSQAGCEVELIETVRGVGYRFRGIAPETP